MSHCPRARQCSLTKRRTDASLKQLNELVAIDEAEDSGVGRFQQQNGAEFLFAIIPLLQQLISPTTTQYLLHMKTNKQRLSKIYT